MFWLVMSTARWAAASPLIDVLSAENAVMAASQSSVDDDGTAMPGDHVGAPASVIALGRRAHPATDRGESLLHGGQSGGGHGPTCLSQHRQLTAERNERISVLNQHFGPGWLRRTGQFLQGGAKR